MKNANEAQRGDLPRIVLPQARYLRWTCTLFTVLATPVLIYARLLPISAFTPLFVGVLVGSLVYVVRWRRVGLAASIDTIVVTGHLLRRTASTAEIRRVSFGLDTADVAVELLDGSSFYLHYGFRFVLNSAERSKQREYASSLRMATGHEVRPRTADVEGFEVRVGGDRVGGTYRPSGGVTTKRVSVIPFDLFEVLVVGASTVAIVAFVLT